MTREPTFVHKTFLRIVTTATKQCSVSHESFDFARNELVVPPDNYTNAVYEALVDLRLRENDPAKLLTVFDPSMKTLLSTNTMDFCWCTLSNLSTNAQINWSSWRFLIPFSIAKTVLFGRSAFPIFHFVQTLSNTLNFFSLSHSVTKFRQTLAISFSNKHFLHAIKSIGIYSLSNSICRLHETTRWPLLYNW